MSLTRTQMAARAAVTIELYDTASGQMPRRKQAATARSAVRRKKPAIGRRDAGRYPGGGDASGGGWAMIVMAWLLCPHCAGP